jgi:hypothetical protein
MKTTNYILPLAAFAAGALLAKSKTKSAVGAIGSVANQLYVDYLEKTVVEDSYDDGEVGNRKTIIFEKNLGMYDANALLSKLSARYGLDGSDKSKWTAFEDGRINYIQLENANGDAASRSEIERWIDGQQVLYSAEYSMGIDKVKTSPATVSYLVKQLGIAA